MLSTRAMSLATLVAVAGLGAVAAPAQAAPAAASTGQTTITAETPVDLFEGLKVSGTCPTGAESAAVTVLQNGADVGGDAFKVAPDGTWSGSVELWDADLGTATATVDCLEYGTEKPLGQATTGSFDIDLPDFPFDEIEVGVTPQRVALGNTITVSATCPAGSTLAAVLAGNKDADDAFVIKEVVPGPNGRISEKVAVSANDGVEPEPGAAMAVVLCGDDSAPLPQLDGARKAARLLAAEEPLAAPALEDMMPTALGIAEFTILPAVVQPTLPTGPTKVVTTPARSAVPAADPAPATPDRLAMTGSDPAPLAAIGAVMLALGAAAIRRARRA